MRLQGAPNGRDHARLAIAVSRRLGGAVVRNRVRRRLRAVLDPHLEALAGLDVVVVAGPEAVTCGHAELSAAVGDAVAVLRRRSAATAVVGDNAGTSPGAPRPSPMPA